LTCDPHISLSPVFIAACVKKIKNEDIGRCTNEGKELKLHISEALATNCQKCTDKQRKGTRTVIAHLINNNQDAWEQLTAKYDPQRKYTAQYEKELKTITA
ncbi:unnamed protein product, partial [Leptosia nina]